LASSRSAAETNQFLDQTGANFELSVSSAVSYPNCHNQVNDLQQQQHQPVAQFQPFVVCGGGSGGETHARMNESESFKLVEKIQPKKSRTKYTKDQV
jgi:hypothetical protein